MLSLALLHETYGFAALVGQRMASRNAEVPTGMVLLDGTMVTEETRMSVVTVTLQQSQARLPSAAVAVIMVLPLEIAVTVPPLLTVATFGLLLCQFRRRLVAFSGQTVA